MRALRASIVVETVKAGRAATLWVTTLITVLGVTGICTSVLTAIQSGRTDLTIKLGPLGTTADWTTLLSVGSQITAAGGVLSLGIGLSWLVGREFAQSTIQSLFGLPVSPAQSVAGKFVVFFAWAVMLAVLIPTGLLIGGLACGLGWPDEYAWGGLVRTAALIPLSALLATPCAWVTTLGRNLLTGVATAIGLIMVAEGGAMVVPTNSFPFTAPAVWALGSAPALGLALTPVVGVVFILLTIFTWRRLQLDR